MRLFAHKYPHGRVCVSEWVSECVVCVRVSASMLARLMTINVDNVVVSDKLFPFYFVIIHDIISHLAAFFFLYVYFILIYAIN